MDAKSSSLDETTIIDRGLAAASLLADPTFAAVIKSLTVECFAAFTETKPSEADKREETYNLFRGLQAIEHELNARVHAKDEVVRRMDEDTASEDFDQPSPNDPSHTTGTFSPVSRTIILD